MQPGSDFLEENRTRRILLNDSDNIKKKIKIGYYFIIMTLYSPIKTPDQFSSYSVFVCVKLEIIFLR